MKLQIKSWKDEKVLYECETENIKEAIVKAIKEKTNLSFADLRFADLSYTNLSSADLRYANLRSADLRSADLSYTNLSFADLSFADLSSADLRYADLRYADLSYADLHAVKGQPIGRTSSRYIPNTVDTKAGDEFYANEKVN